MWLMIRVIRTIRHYRNCFYALFLISMAFTPARDGEPEPLLEPIMLETTELDLLYSDKGVVTFRLQATKRLAYENGDIVYPEGIYGMLYDEAQNITMTLSANKAYQYVDKNIYELQGDVEIKSYQGNKQLNTEALYWNLTDQEIYTDKFVRIETAEELLTGHGLVAKQDLTYYSISSPKGFGNMESIPGQTPEE